MNFENFVDIAGTSIGGTAVSVVNGLGNDRGSVTLAGDVTQFAIGGQELWIDDLTAAPIRLPASVLLLGAGLGGLALTRWRA